MNVADSLHGFFFSVCISNSQATMCARRQTITARESHTQCHLILQLILFTDLFAKKKHRGAREKKSDTHFFSVIQNYPRVGTTRNYLNSHISTLKKGTSLSINSAICFFVAALNNSKWLIQLKLKQNGWTSSSRRIAQWKIIYRRSANGIKKIVIQKNVFFLIITARESQNCGQSHTKIFWKFCEMIHQKTTNKKYQFCEHISKVISVATYITLPLVYIVPVFLSHSALSSNRYC